MNKLVCVFTLLCLSGCSLVNVVENKQQPLLNKQEVNTEAIVNNDNKQVKIMAVGDVMLSRTVGQKMKKLGYDYPYLKTIDLIKSADIAFANLETAITPGREVKSGEMMFRADPESLPAFKEAGFDIVSLANNHTPNYGQKGLLDTFKYLNDNQIKYVGAGKNKDEAGGLVVTEANGIKIGWLAYNADDVVPPSYQATNNSAGTNFMIVEKLKTNVVSAKEKVDLVFVSMHAGTEYTEIPNSMQTNFAQTAIDVGADLVIGHHPHVVQHLEKYKDKYIIYSLGNFVFDQMWSVPTRQGVVAEILADRAKVIEIKFIPIVIENYSQPRLASEEEGQIILKSLNHKLIDGKVVAEEN